MWEIRTSGLMSGDGKRSNADAAQATAPVLDSTRSLVFGGWRSGKVALVGGAEGAGSWGWGCRDGLGRGTQRPAGQGGSLAVRTASSVRLSGGDSRRAAPP